MLSKHSTTKPPLILLECPEMRNAKPLGRRLEGKLHGVRGGLLVHIRHSDSAV